MDDARIQALKQEVLGQLHKGASENAGAGSLETRVAALERTVATLAAHLGSGGTRSLPTAFPTHPSLQVFSFPGPADDRCVMEPDKPCVKSHACRVLGY